MKAFTRERVTVDTGRKQELEDKVLAGEQLTRADGVPLSQRRAAPQPLQACA